MKNSFLVESVYAPTLVRLLMREVDMLEDFLKDETERREQSDRLLAEKVEIIKMLSAQRNKVTKTLSPKKPAKRKVGRPKGSKS
jgi:hypothetical protein